MWSMGFSFSRPDQIFLLGLGLFSASLPLSNFGMSLGQIIMLFAWLSDGACVSKLKSFFLTPIYSVWSFFYLLLFLSILHGGNISDGLNDLRIKLPFLLVPLFFSAFDSRLKRLSVKRILWIFSCSVFISFLVSLAFYFHLFGLELEQTRRYSPFVSHIRLSLMGVLSIIFFYSELEASQRLSIRIFCVSCCTLLIFTMIKLAWFSGLFILGIILIAFSFMQIFVKKKYAVERLLWTLTALTPFLLTFWALKRNAEFFREVSGPPKSILSKTLNGRTFEQHPEYDFTENGYRFGDNICWEELKSAYLSRTGRSTELETNSGWKEEMVLMRYLTSKNLTKDSAGVYSLTQEDLKNIRSGIPNFLLVGRNDFEIKLYEISIEIQSLKKGYNHSGHSVSMRLFSWKRALRIISESPLSGYGISGVRDAFRQSYESDVWPIPKEQRILAHQQYLTIIIALGIPLALLAFAFLSYVPAFFMRALPASYLFFWLLPMLSMFFEDTLETQAGVSFSIFAFVILLPLRKRWNWAKT